MKKYPRILSVMLVLIFFLTVLTAGVHNHPAYAASAEGTLGTPADEEAVPEISEDPIQDGTEAFDPEPTEGTSTSNPAAGNVASGTASDEPDGTVAETTAPAMESGDIADAESISVSAETIATEETDKEDDPDSVPARPVISREIWMVLCAGLLVCTVVLALLLNQVKAENRRLKAKIAEAEAAQMTSVPKTSLQPHVKAPSAVTAPSFFAEGTSGYYAGQMIPIRQQIVFGRDPGCDIRYPAEASSISKVHCALIPDKGGVRLVDLGSSCGTFLGSGKQLQPHHGYILHHGDTFFLGNPDYSFRIK